MPAGRHAPVEEPTFARVQAAAARLGASRSEIFARAAERYLDGLDADSITERMNAALDAAGGTDQSNADAAEHARAAVGGSAADW